jgi:hypothetical protein
MKGESAGRRQVGAGLEIAIISYGLYPTGREALCVSQVSVF